MSKPENPPAFPTHGDKFGMTPGMTLRDWFAGQALAGARVGNWSDDRMNTKRATMIAAEVFLVADAMLTERERQSS